MRIEKEPFHLEDGLENLQKNILGACQQAFVRHNKMKASEFAKDETFRQLVTEMLDVKRMAKSTLRLWLEDQSQNLYSVQFLSLDDAHQQLLGFLKKKMPHAEGNERRVTAMDICKLRGMLDKDLGDVEACSS